MSINNPETCLPENPAVQLFVKLGYNYFDAAGIEAQREMPDDVVLPIRLKIMLKRLNILLDPAAAAKAAREIISVTGETLMSRNRNIYRLLMRDADPLPQLWFGEHRERHIFYIDFQNWRNNDFVIANQVRYQGKTGESILDLVVYVNGLPLAVLLCRSSSQGNAVSEAIKTLNDHRENCETLFHYNQVCAIITETGGIYGAIGPDEFRGHEFKNPDNTPPAQYPDASATPRDTLIYTLFKKEYFLEIIKDYISYEKEGGKLSKKLPRYHQLRAVNKAVELLQTRNKGGVIRHAPGSCKADTMVYLTRKMHREESRFKEPIVLVITDSNESERQLSETFANFGIINFSHTRSAYHLRITLKRKAPKIAMISLERLGGTDEKGRVIREPECYDENDRKIIMKQEINANGELLRNTTVKNREGLILLEKEEIVELPVISTRTNIFVFFIGDVHSSRYAFLADFMRRVMPNARLIIFTGTPLDKESKTLLGEYYGGRYLDVYTAKEAVQDGESVPVFYEDGIPEMFVEKEPPLKQTREEDSTPGTEKKELLWNKEPDLSTYLKAHPRIKRNARHIIEHYKANVFPERFKGMVVAGSRENALAYAAAFKRLARKELHSFRTPVIMSLNARKDPNIYLEYAALPSRIETKAEKFKLPFGNKKNMPKEEKKLYNNDALLIVYDLLLSGYDAPIVQVLYLDKVLENRELLQVIGRVNRVSPGKEAGYIIDYTGITRNLSRALESDAGELNPADEMEPRSAEILRLELRHRQLNDFFSHIAADRTREREQYLEQAVLYLAPPGKRLEFKDLLSRFNRSLRIVHPDQAAAAIQTDFILYNEIRLQADSVYEKPGDYTATLESRILQKIIAGHLKAQGREYLLEKPPPIIDRENFQAEIEKTGGKIALIKKYNRLRYYIREKIGKDPGFYHPLAERLEEAMETIKRAYSDERETVSEVNALDEIRETLINKSREAMDRGFAGEGEYAVFKKLLEIIPLEETARDLTGWIFADTVEERHYTDWYKDTNLQRDIRKKTKKILKDHVGMQEIQNLAWELLKIIIENKESG